MTKQELIAAIAKSTEMTKADAERAADALFGAIGKALKKGDKVAWPGFGSFAVTQRKARDGRNPQTGKKIRIPASKSVKFKPSSKLKESL